MADASALGADGSNPMEVQVLSPAPFDSILAARESCSWSPRSGAPAIRHLA